MRCGLLRSWWLPFTLYVFSGLALCQNAAPTHRAVLVLVIDQPGRVFARDVLEGIQEATRDAIDITLFIDFNGPTALETKEVATKRQQLRMTRYAGQPIEVIVAIGDRVLGDAEKLRAELFPSAKFIFAVQSPKLIPSEIHQGEGIDVDVNPFPSLPAALSLLPQTSHLVVVGGNSSTDEFIRRSFIDSLGTLGTKPEVTFLTGMPLPEVRSRAGHFPENSMIVLTTAMADRSGRATTLADQARELSSVAKVPIIEGTDLAMGLGALGGDVVSMRLTGLEIGKRIKRAIYTGYAPAGLTIDPAPRRKILDWRQLKRFGISESRIPPGFELLNRPPTLWEEHRTAILAVTGGVFLQTVLTLFLLNERRRRRRTEEQNRAMLASLPGFVTMIDGSGQILRQSNRLDLAESELPRPLGAALAKARLGKNLLDLWRADGDASSRVADAIAEVVRGHKSSLVIEHRYETTRDARWVEVRAERLFGEQQGAVVATIDITERKKAESENAQNRQTAWHLNRVAALGELTASLAHEINQPLAAILNSAEAAAALLKRPSPDIPESLEAIGDIIEDDKRAGSVIRKMRSMLKRGYEGTQAVDLDATVRETLRLVASEARLRHVTLHHVSSPDLPPVLADPTQLQQVILNLITNGIEAAGTMPDDRYVKIGTSYLAVEGMLVLEVRDSGPGIPGEKLITIFEPFYTSKREGLGLGLSICRSIVESVGGKITAESHPDEGATFRVLLRSFANVPQKAESVRASA